MRQKIFFSTILNGLVSIGPQIVGLFLLESEDFGLFSAVYLIYALAISIILSVLCDPWVLLSKKHEQPVTYYSSNLAILSLFFGALGACVAYLLADELLIALLGFACVVMSAYRVGARYYLVQTSRWNRAIAADGLSLVALLLAVVLLLLYEFQDFYIVMITWFVSSAIASLVGPYFTGFNRNGISWAKRNWRTIRPLLADSLAMEVSSVGTPYLLLPVLGLNGFGIYRAISNLSAPIRLFISPLRPMIVASPQRILRKKFTILAIAGAISIALVSWAALFWLNSANISIGVLSEVAAYAVPSAMYLTGAVFLSIYQIVVRSQQITRNIFIGRLVQTVAGVALPVGGYYMFGLTGAMWAYGTFSLLTGMLWMMLSMSQRSNMNSAAPVKSGRVV